MTRICIIQPSLNQASETFIRAHGERLAEVIAVVHAKNGVPWLNDAPVLSQNMILRAGRKIQRIITRRDWMWEIDLAYATALRRTRTQVVLAEYGPTGVAVMEACKIADVPLVVHFHGYDASVRTVIDQNRDSYCEMFSRAAAIVVVSRAMVRSLVNLGCSPEKLILNPYGIDCEQFSQASPGSACETFVAVGRLVEKKAPHLLLLAFARALQACPNAKLRIVGNGDLLPICRDIVRAHGLDHAVALLGEQPHDVVAHEMQHARAFVQHSIIADSGDSEGTPVAVLEAGASGLPVIATRHAGIPDVVIDGETGLLVDEHDVAGMADRMIQLARDSQFANRLGQNGRKRVRSRYRMEQSINRLNRILVAATTGGSMADVKQSVETELVETQNYSADAKQIVE